MEDIMDNKKIGIFISEMRKEHKLTQKALAEKLFVSDKAVSKWERSICMPDISLIDKLAEILDVSVGEILKGEKIIKISKKENDNVIKESVNYFQKRYFLKKIKKNRINFIINIFNRLLNYTNNRGI